MKLSRDWLIPTGQLTPLKAAALTYKAVAEREGKAMKTPMDFLKEGAEELCVKPAQAVCPLLH
ncbi:hypothetical protein [Pyrobaculum aerophilum]|uniref:hypothetical protein n=1 Tax=Pyrobaculum aerophilum TaxID=13773 RepID=UPI0011C0497B|nr:hypothetical protein [Pyrobaculum aerophilum]